MSGSLLLILAGALVSAALGALVMCLLVYWDGFRLASMDERAPDVDRRRATFRRGHAAAAAFFVITGVLVTAAVAGLGRASAPPATASQAPDDGLLLNRLTTRALLLADRVESFIRAIPSPSVAERFSVSERRVPPSARPAASSADRREAVSRQALDTAIAPGSAIGARAAVGIISGADPSTPTERQVSIAVGPPRRARAVEIVVREERTVSAPSAIPAGPEVVMKPELDTVAAPATTLTPALEIIPPRETQETPAPPAVVDVDARAEGRGVVAKPAAPQVERADRSARSARLERPDKLDRPEKADRPEKLDRVEKIDRPEKVERPEKLERPERVERPEKLERPEKIEKVQKVERVERPERSGRR